MLNNKNFYVNIYKKKYYAGIDIMNRNTIISLAMLYALWQSKHKDLLALIRPFVLYAVGTNTKVGDIIDVNSVCECMTTEFGYKYFPVSIVNKVLLRETAERNRQGQIFVKKKNNNFILKKSLTDQIVDFSDKRTDCKRKSDAVTTALAEYLNKQCACGRSNYSQVEAETLLLSFFENRGNSVLRSVDDLHQIISRNNEIEFFVAQFILEQDKKKSVYMDYLVELVKGYFVTIALYLQADNADITTASFKDVTFFLDTRILLAFLGYKTSQENDSVQEMIRSLQRHGARLACFGYNIIEVENILSAYKMSKVQSGRKNSNFTLEYFDENNLSYTHVEAAQRTFPQKLQEAGINDIDPASILESYGVANKSDGLLNEDEIKNCVLLIKPKYNLSSLPDDIQAINTISRIRKGKKYEYIEKCKAVFVTSNPVLVSATKHCIEKTSYEPGFPLAITDEDLCVIAWLKDFQRNNNLPKMRLLENVLAAVTPTPELMEAYYSHLDNLESLGVISSDEASLLRIDIYAQKELMDLTHGNPDAISQNIVETIRQRVKAKSFEEGVVKGREESKEAQRLALAEKRNSICKNAEEEVRHEYEKKKRWGIIAIKSISVIVAIVFVTACILDFASNKDNISIPLFIITIVSTVQGACPFFNNNFWTIRKYKEWLRRKELQAIDERKEKYLSIFES